MFQARLFCDDLADVAEGGEGVDEALDRRGADAGEVAGEGFRAVGRLPRGLADHAAHKGDLVRECVGPGEGFGRLKDEG